MNEGSKSVVYYVDIPYLAVKSALPVAAFSALESMSTPHTAPYTQFN